MPTSSIRFLLVSLALLTGTRSAHAQQATRVSQATPAQRSASVQPAGRPKPAVSPQAPVGAQPTGSAQPSAGTQPTTVATASTDSITISIPAETGIRQQIVVPVGGVALWEHPTDKEPARRWPAGRTLYVQTVPDTTWFRVLLFGNSYYVRQREMPVPGWQPGTK